MPFPTTGSVISTDLDNMLRGLFRDNSDHAVTGTVAETTMASFSLGANTVGPTGGLFIYASGTASGAGGTKTVKLYLGATALHSQAIAANSQEWLLKAYIFNTSTGAQRAVVEISYFASGGGAPTSTFHYVTSSIDTTAAQTVKLTTTNASAGDTCTQSMMDVFVVQIN